MKILICFGNDNAHSGHGLGDCVMLTAVLHHLKAQYPQWRIHVACGVGRESTFRGLAEATYILGKQPPDNQFDRVFWLQWPEVTGQVYPDWPSTKTVKCIAEHFHLDLRWDLLRYSLQVGPEAQARADEYIQTLPEGTKGYVCIHYEGNTSKAQKDLYHSCIFDVCQWLSQTGYTPVILDWDNRSPVPNNRTVFCPDVTNPLWQGRGTGDTETLAALMSKSALNICIDSGPGKVAMALDVPHIAVWTRFHPIHFADNTKHNTIHLVPENHEDYIRGDKALGRALLDRYYKWTTYPTDFVSSRIINQAAKILKANVMSESNLLKSKAFNQDYYDEHRQAGLDYLGHGEWQQNYAKWITEVLGLQGKTMLDVGCACGSIAAGFAKAGVLASGVDPNEHMIGLGRKQWPGFPLYICDACNLHYFEDNTFDFLHSAQVFEHFKPELVPFILKELYRVAKPGAVLFAAFDTAEMYERQGRKLEDEDATHQCVKPLAWWLPLLEQAGWKVDPALLESLKTHPSSYFKMYDWDALACRKP